MGAATEMISFIKAYAKAKGFRRIELNVWEFNQGALAFYEERGFETYRRYMEMIRNIHINPMNIYADRIKRNGYKN